MVTGWITDRIGDDPFCPLFIDTMLNNNGPFLKIAIRAVHQEMDFQPIHFVFCFYFDFEI